jgi:hypothetical protein
MMKKVLVLLLVMGLASGASAALTFVDVPTDPINIGESIAITLNNSEDGSYGGWLEITDQTVADYDGDPVFTTAGDPEGKSTVDLYVPDPSWYEFTVASTDADNPVVAGDHLVINIAGLSEGTTTLSVYANDGVTLLDSASITVVPEPMTIALLGLGGLFLRRRKLDTPL